MQSQTKGVNLADLEALWGPPPILRTEDPELYDRFRAYFMGCLAPEEPMSRRMLKKAERRCSP
jgi:hypothetical protein